MSAKTYRVGVVGATGAVGDEMVRTLFARKFPLASLRLFASAKSKGKTLAAGGAKIKVEEADAGVFKELDLALFSAGSGVSKRLAPEAAKAGCVVVDNSSAWRMDPEVPLIVPEVNADALTRESLRRRIIANPNCSTIQMVVALKPIHDAAGLTRVIVSTYQAVSGAGARAMFELADQTRAVLAGKPAKPEFLPHRIAFNVFSHNSPMLPNGYNEEEVKMINETRKILGVPDLAVTATCVRVPVMRGHAEAVWVETEGPLSPEEARGLLAKAPGIVVDEDPVKNRYPMPVDAAGRGEVFVGRIRRDLSHPHGLVLWVVSDNLLKGAALNAVQIAEELVRRQLIG